MQDYGRVDQFSNYLVSPIIAVGGRSTYIPNNKRAASTAELEKGQFSLLIDKAKAYWEESSAKRKIKNSIISNPEADEEEADADVIGNDPVDDFKTKLQEAINNMSPAKFEQFSRALLTEMGVKFTEKSIKISNDGGIDGYGYHRDEDDFRTTRVVIQCKRYNTGKVGEPEINQFLGAMSKFQADYGVFITNNLFTEQARQAAAEGKPITLIDGSELIKLVMKYELYITPVKTYLLDDFYLDV